MRTPALPSDEEAAVRNWARHADPVLWEAVPRARPFMIRCAASDRAEAAFYGLVEDMRPLYAALAERMIAALSKEVPHA